MESSYLLDSYRHYYITKSLVLPSHYYRVIEFYLLTTRKEYVTLLELYRNS